MTFLGLNAAEWQAILSFVLILVTTTYVIVTWRIAKAAQASAASAEESAASTRRAVTEMREANIIAGAGLVDFTATYVLLPIPEGTPGVGTIAVDHIGPPVYIYSVTIERGRDDNDQPIPGLEEGTALDWFGVREAGELFRRGDPLIFPWPGQPIPEQEAWRVTVAIEYSLEADGQHRTQPTRLRSRREGRPRRKPSS